MQSYDDSFLKGDDEEVRYKIAEGGNASECEIDSDDETTTFHEERELGKGVSDLARLFGSKDNKQKITVLKPVDDKNADFEQASVKEEFFRKNHPSKKVKLVIKNGTYRLVVPYFSGNTYKKDAKGTLSDDAFLEYCIEAVKALRKCHFAGLVVIDFKSDNIIFDPVKRKARLIDGGLSCKNGKPLDPVFRLKIKLKTPDKIIKAKKKRIEDKKNATHIALEAWSEDTGPEVVADERMDIYSFGDLMEWMLNRDSSREQSTLGTLIKRLIIRCKDEKPELRPSLDQLEDKLKAIRTIMIVMREITNSEVDFSWISSEQEMNEHRDSLMQKLTSQVTLREFVTACRMFNHQLDELNEFKQKQIEAAYQERLAEVRKAQEGTKPAIKNTIKTARSPAGLFSPPQNSKRLKSGAAEQQEQVNPNLVRSSPAAIAA